MLMGEFHHNIDEKGRIILPSRIRKEFGDSVVVTRGLEDSLFVYSIEEWSLIVSKLESLPFTKKDARNFTRMFLSGATMIEFDKQGRIKLPSSLIDYASIVKECVLIGVGERLEIWSLENWNKFLNEEKENLSDMADSLFDTNLVM